MPKYGDKFYHVRHTPEGGVEMEEVSFIEESLADPGCEITTYVFRGKDRRRFRTCKESYSPTKQEAIDKELQRYPAALEGAERQIAQAQENLERMQQNVLTLQDMLEACSPQPQA